MDDVLLGKAASIERCVQRAREEFAGDRAGFLASRTRQDAAILNVLRACETAHDLAQHCVRRRRLGVPQGARDAYRLLAEAGLIPRDLADGLARMVGFRNIAVHEYRRIEMPVVVAVIEGHLDDFTRFTSTLLTAPEPPS